MEENLTIKSSPNDVTPMLQHAVSSLSVFLFLLSVALLLVGILKPSWFSGVLGCPATRRNILSFGLAFAILLFFMSIVVTGSPP
jgi:uncharacterized membrane protein (DUF485 family)